jgi:hypothetical protein
MSPYLMTSLKEQIISIKKLIKNSHDYKVILTHCLKKLECKKEKWRKILKTLFLVEHILKTGSGNFYDAMRQDISKLKYLHSFSFMDETKADKGETSIFI